MPEGPEIRRAADQIANVLKGKVVQSAELSHPSLSGAEKFIIGHKVEGVETRGKAMLTHFSSDKTMYSHNQLYGVWRVSVRGHVPKTKRALRIGLHTEEGSAFLYSATDISFWDRNTVDQHPFLKRLGPDLLSEGISAELITERLLSKEFKNRRLSSLYLNQGFIAGIGNYLRSEILFFAGVDPKLKPRDLDLAEKQKLSRVTLEIGLRSYRTGGNTLPPRLLPESAKKKGRYFERDRFAVFARAGKSCRVCKTSIEKESLASRRIYWCPACQST